MFFICIVNAQQNQLPNIVYIMADDMGIGDISALNKDSKIKLIISIKSKDDFPKVKEQIESCMEKSDWRKYVDNDEDEEELKRFIGEFFPCFKDSNGNPYFQ